MCVKTRRLHHLRFRVCRRQVIGPENQFLYPIVPGGNGTQRGLHLIALGNVATLQQRQRAEAQSTTQDVAAIDLRHQRLVFAKDGLIDPPFGPKIDVDEVRIDIV